RKSLSRWKGTWRCAIPVGKLFNFRMSDPIRRRPASENWVLTFVTIGPPDGDTLGMSGNGGTGDKPRRDGDQKNSRLPIHVRPPSRRNCGPINVPSVEHYPRTLREAATSVAMRIRSRERLGASSAWTTMGQPMLRIAPNPSVKPRNSRGTAVDSRGNLPARALDQRAAGAQRSPRVLHLPLCGLLRMGVSDRLQTSLEAR